MNTPRDRPLPRQEFLSADRQFRIFFYTSSISKYLQARVVFERSGLILDHFKSKQDPYSEDYSLGKDVLLERAIKQILGSVGSGSLFFVEDTSLRIEILSRPLDDFPGLQVKEWFAKTTFKELDLELRKRGNDRRAIIKSDIALHLPGLDRPVYFYGSVGGVVSETSPNFEENPHYPWLTPASFNGWFIPSGSHRRLGEMSLEESWKYDFRIQSLELLLSRLEEYTAILNVPSQAYLRRPAVDYPGQLSLIQRANLSTVLLVVGHTCAGKTTFGERAQGAHQHLFIEASSVLRMVEREGGIAAENAFTAAAKTLESYGPDVVARKILEMYKEKLAQGCVITGFRTMEEVEVLKKAIPRAKLVLIQASDRTRFERHIQRGRSQSVETFDGFKKVDAQQWSFGLLRVAEEFSDIKVVNEGTIQDYYEKIDVILTGGRIDTLPGISTRIRPKHGTDENQLFRCLLILEEAGRPLTCEEIEEGTRQSGRAIRHNNANKVLKRVPELARRLDADQLRVRYELLNPGRAYIRLMNQKSMEISDPKRKNNLTDSRQPSDPAST